MKYFIICFWILSTSLNIFASEFNAKLSVDLIVNPALNIELSYAQKRNLSYSVGFLIPNKDAAFIIDEVDSKRIFVKTSYWFSDFYKGFYLDGVLSYSNTDYAVSFPNEERFEGTRKGLGVGLGIGNSWALGNFNLGVSAELRHYLFNTDIEEEGQNGALSSDLPHHHGAFGRIHFGYQF